MDEPIDWCMSGVACVQDMSTSCCGCSTQKWTKFGATVTLVSDILPMLALLLFNGNTQKLQGVLSQLGV